MITRDAGTNTEQNGCAHGSHTMAASAHWDKLCEGKQWRYYENSQTDAAIKKLNIYSIN